MKQTRRRVHSPYQRTRDISVAASRDTPTIASAARTAPKLDHDTTTRTMNPAPRSLRINLTHVLLFSVLLLSVTLSFHHFTPTTAIIDDLLNAYNPISRSALVQSRLKQKCSVRLPTQEQLKQYPFSDWALSRFAAYYNIYHFLKTFWSESDEKPAVLDFGESAFLAPFNRSIRITRTKYPNVDIHRTSFPSNSFDAVAADQVLEHTTFPHLAMFEMHRILKPGGIALITTVAYNPLHESSSFHDLWRFMLDGMLVLSMPFEGGVKICGSWGSAHVVAVRAAHGMGSPTEQGLQFDGRADQLKGNDLVNPFLVWLVVQK